jgi:hypothetical protein
VLQPYDIIEGAQAPDQPNLFVIGAYDSRITFYSQQVRALELVHALQHQGRIRGGMRIAVVGGGAAGVTAAAAVGLISDAQVDLYERGDEVLSLQRASDRRRLDPHIYDWPAPGTDDPIADLPLLDWTAGSARDVRRDLKQQFDALVAVIAPQLWVNIRHTVTAVQRDGPALRLDFSRDPLKGEEPNDAGRVEAHGTFDLVLLAFGFGLEPAHGVAGVTTASYWSDAGVPVAEFEGRPTPRFLISGNGDGALIDLVAAASAHFDHAGMIREIVRQPNIDRIFERLQAIDTQAREASRNKQGFDFLAAYDAEIRDDLSQLGLFELVTHRLRSGVRIILQTLKSEAFSIETATLNRLSAYLVIRACETGGLTDFRHLHCADIVPAPTPAPAPYTASLWFDCGGEVIGVDQAIIRRGPERAAARAPFSSVLSAFEVDHKAWLARHGEDTLVPTLSAPARELFTRAAERRGLPPALHLQRALAGQMPERVQVQPVHGQLLWSGAFAPSDVARVWRDGASQTDILCPAGPDTLGPGAAAIVRVALHAQRGTLIGDSGVWRPYAECLSSASPHAEGLNSPNIRPGPLGGAGRDPQHLAAADLAATIHAALDCWMLGAIDQRLRDYFVGGRDPGNVISFRAAPDLLARMAQIWTAWCAQFHANADLLSRFLRLIICAQDDDDSVNGARVLLGPRKLALIVRATAVAVAVATGWAVMTPRPARPGNLARALTVGDPWTGHACAADLIEGEPMALSAGRYIWRTNFVVLPAINTPVEVTARAAAGLGHVDTDQPSFTETDERPNIILTLDQGFRTATLGGQVALAALLNHVETTHFTRLRIAIEEDPA